MGRFKVESLPRMINKEVLVQFIYKPTKSTEKLLTIKKLAIIYSSYVPEERG